MVVDAGAAAGPELTADTSSGMVLGALRGLAAWLSEVYLNTVTSL